MLRWENISSLEEMSLGTSPRGRYPRGRCTVTSALGTNEYHLISREHYIPARLDNKSDDAGSCDAGSCDVADLRYRQDR